MPRLPKGVELSPRAEKFCHEYMLDRDIGRAYVRAGYKAKYPDRNGSRLMMDPRIKKRIARLEERDMEKRESEQEYLRRRYQDIEEAAFDAAQYNAARGALDSIARMSGLFVDKLAVGDEESLGLNISLNFGPKEVKAIDGEVDDAPVLPVPTPALPPGEDVPDNVLDFGTLEGSDHANSAD